jgi:hypothetical protein
MFRHSKIKRFLVAGLVIGAASFPAAAQARFLISPPGTSMSQPARVASVPTRPQPSSGAQSGFQWGDAGIGAGGAVVLVGVGAVTASATRRRRVQRVITG